MQTQTHKDVNPHRDHRVGWILFGAASLLVMYLFVAMAVYLSTVPKPWREGIRTVGQTCTQGFRSSPQTPGGAAIEVASKRTKTCGYAYAIQTGGVGTQYLLTLDETEVDARSTVDVTLTAYDGWRTQHQVRRSIQGPARLRGVQLAVDVSPRTTLVEVSTSIHGGGRYALQGVTLQPSTEPRPAQ